MSSGAFDVLVVGSGMTGGWAALELTRRGLRVLLLERGRSIEHGRDYPTEGLAPWELAYRGLGDPFSDQGAPHSKSLRLVNELVNEYNAHFFARFSDAPYQTERDAPFNWIRGHQLGGRSITWSRQSLRWGGQDFSANARDGHGLPWPIDYAELEPWYGHVEAGVGVSGSNDGVECFPDGNFQPAMALTAFETHFAEILRSQFPGRQLIAPRTANLTESIDGRGVCAHRDQCSRGCSLGAYFSSLSSTLPLARATGRLEIRTDTLVEALDIDRVEGRARGVRVIDVRTGTRELISAPTVMLCASAFSTLQILLNTRLTNGLPDFGGPMLGRYIMDHPKTVAATGLYNGLDHRVSLGRRSSSPIVPRFQNVGDDHRTFHRGYFYNLIAFRLGWSRGAFLPGIGAQFKHSLSRPGAWGVGLPVFAECLPYADNKVSLHETQTDRFGIPQLMIRLTYRENELLMLDDAMRESVAMLRAAGVTLSSTSARPGTPGNSAHEMGGAAMGEDPARSVTDPEGRLHTAHNVVIGDGAVMNSSACQNPSLTYMALAARAANRLADRIQAGHS